MTHSPSKPALALTITTVALASAIALLAPPSVQAAGESSVGAGERCYDARAGKRKTSLGIHQWTARLRVQWCVAGPSDRPSIVSVSRDTSVRTGTNWRLITRSGGVDRDNRRRVTAESRFHFRLRYPSFEQNCYPRIALTLFANGGFERSVNAGC
jgi:hypothetical protein